MHNKLKIYLLGANNRATHTLAEQYRKHNYYVTVISWSENNIRYSKFVDEFILLPNVELDFAAFKKGFLNIFANEKDLLIPVNDVAILICEHCKILLHNKVKIIGLNTAPVQQFAINKYLLLQLAIQCNIDCPATRYISTLDDFYRHENELTFPIIAKPISSRLLQENTILSFQVKKYNAHSELADYIRENINVIPIMLQECLEPGYGIGLNFIAQDGVLIDYYFHQRIHEAWGGGESSYRRTINDDIFDLVPKAKVLIKKMGWNGVGMLEFRVTNNKAYLMELNGRFWGSIGLGVFAGKSFPLQLLSLGTLKEQEAVYQDRIFYARNFRMELIWLMKGVFSQKRLTLPFTWIWNLRYSARRNEIIEDNLFNDFWYRIRDLIDIVKLPLGKKMAGFKSKQQQDFLWQKISCHQYLPTPGDNVVYICMGNICRSPFAEMYSQLRYPGYTFYSTGFVVKSGRLPPIAAVNAANKHNVDVALHLSTVIDNFANKKVDAWFIMDRSNLMNLIEALPAIDMKKIFSVGGVNEIPDPFNKDAANFEATFTDIAWQLDRIFSNK